MSTLIAERFCAVRIGLWDRGFAAANADDREIIRRYRMVDPHRRPNIPDILILDAEGALVERTWSFATGEELFEVLVRALRATGREPPFDHGACFGQDAAGHALRALEDGTPEQLDAWIAAHGADHPDLLPIATLYRAEAAARAGDEAAAEAGFEQVARTDHPVAHRARFHLLNFDIWPVPRHPALRGAPPQRPDRFPVEVPDPPARDARIAALRTHPGVRWLAGLPFVRIPAGRFTMGWDRARFPRERPERRVRISRDYWMAAWPVTRGLWARWDPGRWPAEGPAAELPALGVSWTEAKAFCAWLSEREGLRFRLPTEAEWERAARGGVDGEPRPWGADPPDPTRCNTHLPYPVPVACYPPNRYGLFDVLGNGHEWVEDCYRPDALERMAPDTADPLCLDPLPQHVGLRVQRSMFPAPMDLIHQVAYTAIRSYGFEDESFGGRGLRLVAEPD